MKTKLLTFGVLIYSSFFSLTAQQSEKTSVGVLDFTSNLNISDAWKSSIQNTVVTGFNNAKRFIIVDRSQLEALNNERNLQKSEDFINSSVNVAQAQSIGAQFIISGNISAASVNSEYKTTTNSKGATLAATVYNAIFSVQLKVVNVSTGAVESSTTLTGEGSDGMVSGILSIANNGEEQAAVSSALGKLTRNVDNWVGVAFPATFAIAEIQESDPSKGAKKILVAGGSEYGLVKGDRLKVIEEVTMNVGGKNTIRKKQIGELKIKAIESESFSVCSVTDGGSEIMNAFNNKAKIYVQTIK